MKRRQVLGSILSLPAITALPGAAQAPVTEKAPPPADATPKLAITSEELCRGTGFEVVAKHFEMVPPGESILDLGTCRMGADPKTSVLNQFNQSHDVRNLFVMDGTSFVSGGPQNPTLTMLALAMRASGYLAEELRKSDL